MQSPVGRSVSLQLETARRSQYEAYQEPSMGAMILVQPRERAVLDLAVQGFANVAIGKRLSITAQTVKWHLTNVTRKIGLQPPLQSELCQRACVVLWWARVRGKAEATETGAVVVPGAQMLPRAAQAYVT